MTDKAKLIGVDWGTSSFRAYLMDGGGRVLDRRSSGNGILAVAAGGFETVLADEIGPWRATHGDVPIVMSGMIGSRQGWREAAYAKCPAALADIAGNLLLFASDRIGDIAVVPGLSVVADGVPDVMRGEETQILGAIASGGPASGSYVLPGTHSKWVRVQDRRIESFATYMTGEVFSALKDHTILGRLMSQSEPENPQGFARGVRAGAAAGSAGALLHRLFSARTLGLFDQLAGPDVAGYLSGLVIGAELQDAAPRGAAFTLIGSDALVARYEAAAACLGLQTARAPADCVVQGHIAIARAAGLIRDAA